MIGKALNDDIEIQRAVARGAACHQHPQNLEFARREIGRAVGLFGHVAQCQLLGDGT